MMNDPHSELIHEHRQILDLLKTLRDSFPNDLPAFTRHFENFYRLLRLHLHKEDEGYYKVADENKKANDRELMHALRNDHAALIFGIESLAIKLRRQSPVAEVETRFRAIDEVIVRHFANEEKDLFTAIGSALSEDQVQKIKELMANVHP